MNVLVTGANGFIGKNLINHLNDQSINVLTYTRANSIKDLSGLLMESDFIIHLAGANKPKDKKDFDAINEGLTSLICDTSRAIGRKIPIILASSLQAGMDNPYGQSKVKAEIVVQKYKADTNSSVYIFRLPGVFGKGCKPNYNSVVATLCHNLNHNLPIHINNPSHELKLVYIDDVVKKFINIVQGKIDIKKELFVQPEYRITVGELNKQLNIFKENCGSLDEGEFSDEFVRKLNLTYESYLPTYNYNDDASKV